MTGAQFLANNIAQLMLEISAQIDAAAAKDKLISELEAGLPSDSRDMLTCYRSGKISEKQWQEHLRVRFKVDEQ